ncbi:MAG: hypothetical protein M1823_005359 [Watsoniomyces obsoletus]|nr:MAG: hypothetical protein M1823_005359 [Watsoniomyces obsoletus]
MLQASRPHLLHSVRYRAREQWSNKPNPELGLTPGPMEATATRMTNDVDLLRRADRNRHQIHRRWHQSELDEPSEIEDNWFKPRMEIFSSERPAERGVTTVLPPNGLGGAGRGVARHGRSSSHASLEQTTARNDRRPFEPWLIPNRTVTANRQAITPRRRAFANVKRGLAAFPSPACEAAAAAARTGRGELRRPDPCRGRAWSRPDHDPFEGVAARMLRDQIMSAGASLLTYRTAN